MNSEKLSCSLQRTASSLGVDSPSSMASSLSVAVRDMSRNLPAYSSASISVPSSAM